MIRFMSRIDVIVVVKILLLLLLLTPKASHCYDNGDRSSSKKKKFELKLEINGHDANNEDFSYRIKVGDSSSRSTDGNEDPLFTTWLVSSETRLGDYTSQDGSLKITEISKGNGTDDGIFGHYYEYTIVGWTIVATKEGEDKDEKYMPREKRDDERDDDVSEDDNDDGNDNDDDVDMYTLFITYPNDPSFIVMIQSFPKEYINTKKAGYDPHRPKTESSSLSMEDNDDGYVYDEEDTDDEDEDEHSSLAALTLFPSFRRPNSSSSKNEDQMESTDAAGTITDDTIILPDLACVSYHHIFPQMKYNRLSNYKESHLGGIPLVVYNETDPTLPSLIISPITWPLASHMASTSQMFGIGIKSTVSKIPDGWKQTFIISGDYGIYNSFMKWGDKMTKIRQKMSRSNSGSEGLYGNLPLGKHHKDTITESIPLPESSTSSNNNDGVFERSNNMYRDAAHSTIGFWTDNGGYYHYNTGIPNATYEEVLPKVKAYHDNLNIPFGHWQIDSWFYPKDAKVNKGGGGGAVINWTSMDSVFPSGMVAFQNSINLPMIMHNRQWSVVSDYIKHWSNEEIPWYTGPNFAIPQNPEKFFRKFFTQQVGWGLTMYEQDWMCTQYDGTEALQTNISLGDLWLQGMAIGAAAHNLTVQYCMPYPNQVLAAAGMSHVVTNARATGDYWPNSTQWQIGPTSLLYWALGILPLKDGFYSSTNLQVGGYPEGPEQRPDLQALIATLSCAMVGPMDGLNLINATRIMTTCRSDGTILKPDQPIRTSDSCFYRDPNVNKLSTTTKPHDPTQCFIYVTHSDIPGLGRVRYVFSNETNTPVTPSMAHLGTRDSDDEIGSSTEYTIYNWYTGDLQLLQKENNVEPGYEGHSYSVITQVLAGGWIFLGEVDKYVPISRLRVNNVVALDGNKLEVIATGVANEEVKFCVAKISDLARIHCETITFKSALPQIILFEQNNVGDFWIAPSTPKVSTVM